jgi:hypothetical protein
VTRRLILAATRGRRCAAAAAIAIGVSSTSSESRGQPEGVPDDLVIKLERTRCFGACPVYTVSIDAKGNVIYEGIRFVTVQGRVTDRIPIARVAALLATADRIGFFELRDQYRTKKNPDGSETIVTDLPTTFVTITSRGRTKRIEDYYGAPDSLEELERQIDDAAGTKRWIKAEDRVPRIFVPRGASTPNESLYAGTLSSPAVWPAITCQSSFLFSHTFVVR